MHYAKNDVSNEWKMPKTQVQSFFSRLAAMRQKEQGMVGISPDLEEDAECLQEDANWQDLTEKVNMQLSILYQICYGNFDPCERYHSNTV